MKKIQATVMLFGVMFLVTGTVMAQNIEFEITPLNQSWAVQIDTRVNLPTSSPNRALFEVLSADAKKTLPREFSDDNSDESIANWLHLVKNNLSEEEFNKFINLQKQSKHKQLATISEKIGYEK